MLAECAGCGTRFAPDLDRCPQCGAERAEDGMPKIIAGSGPSFAEGHGPDDVPQVPDAVAPEPAGDVAAELEEVRAELEHIEAEAAPAPEPAHAPRLPPRRTPPPGAG